VLRAGRQDSIFCTAIRRSDVVQNILCCLACSVHNGPPSPKFQILPSQLRQTADRAIGLSLATTIHLFNNYLHAMYIYMSSFSSYFPSLSPPSPYASFVFIVLSLALSLSAHLSLYILHSFLCALFPSISIFCSKHLTLSSTITFLYKKNLIIR
jgi:hypothetical protein